MSATPRLTVITPNLNQGHYLEQTICSVLDQGQENLEFIVTDGGSTDGSLRIVRLYEDHLRCWRSGPDSGPGSAINWAMSRASGEYVTILPSHDLLLPGALARATDALEASEDADWLVGEARVIGPSDEPLGSIEPHELIQDGAPNRVGPVLARPAAARPPFAACCFRKRLLDSVGPMVESGRVEYGTDLFRRLIRSGHRPARLNQTLAAVRDVNPEPPDRTALWPTIQINTSLYRDADRREPAKRAA